ncbi:unnamed protein product [Amoebophrya sp. A120]|nr:unnamed protein product [Amoebophrya sp. A120]|eukprot:GSA120T00005390001.1
MQFRFKRKENRSARHFSKAFFLPKRLCENFWIFINLFLPKSPSKRSNIELPLRTSTRNFYRRLSCSRGSLPARVARYSWLQYAQRKISVVRNFNLVTFILSFVTSSSRGCRICT